MDKVSAKLLFDFSKGKKLTLRQKITSDKKTVLVIFLDKDEDVATEQLTFYWKGLTQKVYILGAKNHPLEYRVIRRLLTEGGKGYPPRNYFQDPDGNSCTQSQTEWFVTKLKHSAMLLKVENIIVSHVQGFPFGFEDYAKKLLREHGVKKSINFYKTAEIDKVCS